MLQEVGGGAGSVITGALLGKKLINKVGVHPVLENKCVSVIQSGNEESAREFTI